MGAFQGKELWGTASIPINSLSPFVVVPVLAIKIYLLYVPTDS